MKKTRKSEATDDLGFEIPEFKTEEEFDAWWDALPKVKADVDPRLLQKEEVSIRLSRRVTDGFDYLAEQWGLRSGRELMRIVLGNCVAKHLPPDF